jgi:RNA polymerase sigma factor (sigma-70 family)
VGLADSVLTRPSLLIRIRDGRDRESWAEFVDVYAPLVYGFARQQDLQDADAADLTQEVLSVVSVSIGRLDYDPARGSFRGWRFTIVGNRLRNFLDRERRQHRGYGSSSAQEVLDAVPAPDDEPDVMWERDYETRLFECAAQRVCEEVQPSTWRAFWLTAVEGRSGKDAARELHMTAAAVYLAKRRVRDAAGAHDPARGADPARHAAGLGRGADAAAGRARRNLPGGRAAGPRTARPVVRNPVQHRRGYCRR